MSDSKTRRPVATPTFLALPSKLTSVLAGLGNMLVRQIQALSTPDNLVVGGASCYLNRPGLVVLAHERVLGMVMTRFQSNEAGRHGDTGYTQCSRQAWISYHESGHHPLKLSPVRPAPVRYVKHLAH